MEAAQLAAALDTASLPYRRHLATSLQQANLYAEALQEWKSISEKDSEMPYADKLAYAIAAFESNNYSLCCELCEILLAVNPEDAQAHLLLGKAQLATKSAGGEQHLFRATELSPKAVEAWLALSNHFQESGDLDSA